MTICFKKTLVLVFLLILKGTFLSLENQTKGFKMLGCICSVSLMKDQ